MLSYPIALFAVALCALPAPAQEKRSPEGKRSRVRAIVVDASGKPVAKAKITFAGRLMPAIDLGDLDLQHATSDERGRARAQLLVNRSYSAWAEWKDAKGKDRLSKIVEEVGSGMLVRFVEADTKATSQRVDLRAIKTWRPLGPLAGRVRLGTETLLFHPVEINEKGRAEIPPIPLDRWGYFGVELLGAGGQSLAGGRTKAKKRRIFPVPPPSFQKVEIKDAEGKAIEGAEAWVGSGPANWGMEGRRGTKTDKDGRIDVAVATSTVIRGLHFRMRFSKAGYQDVYAGPPGQARTPTRRSSRRRRPKSGSS